MTAGKGPARARNAGPSTIEEARAAIALDPARVMPRLALARMLYGAGEYDAAEAEVAPVLALHANNVPAMTRMFAICQQRDQIDDAATWARRVTEAQPDNATAFLRLGSILVTAREPKAAAAALRRSLELEPDKSHTLRLLAEAYMHMPSWGEAVTVAQQLADLSPDDAVAQIVLLRAVMGYGDYDRTMEMYYRVMALAPDHPAIPGLEHRLEDLYRSRFKSRRIVREAPPPRVPWRRLLRGLRLMGRLAR